MQTLSGSRRSPPLKLLFVGDSLLSESSAKSLSSFYCDLNKEDGDEDNAKCASDSDDEKRIVWILASSGLEEYLYNISSVAPDYVFIPISAESGITSRIRDYIGVALSLRRPIVFILTLTELTRESEYKATLKVVETTVVKWMRKEMFLLNTESLTDETVKRMSKGTIVPVATVPPSGDIASLRKLVNALEPSHRDLSEKSPCEVWISKRWNTAEGQVACEGIVRTGKLQVNKYLRIGPLDSQFYTIVVRKMSTYKDSVESADAGERVIFAADLVKGKRIREERQKVVAVEKLNKQKLVQEFDAEIAILAQEDIKVGQSFTVFSGNVHTTVTIQETERELRCQGDRGIVRCKFSGLEYTETGEKLFLVSDKVVAIGVITKAYQ